MELKEGIELIPIQTRQIEELEEEIGKQFSIVEKNTGCSNSIQIVNNQIIGLRLSKSKLREFPEIILELKTLQTLSLDHNELSVLPDSFGILDTLQELNLGANQLTKLPESFGKLKNLEMLWLNDNKLINLPNSFNRLKRLKLLNLNNNRFKTLPDALENLESLYALDVGKNFLSCLPVCISKLKNLRYLLMELNPWNEEWEIISKKSIIDQLEFCCKKRNNLKEFKNKKN